LLARARPSWRLFRDGERKNRKKNRLKFLIRAIGEKELFRRLDVELERVLAERGSPLRDEMAELVRIVSRARAAAPGAGHAARRRSILPLEANQRRPQTQDGYHVATIKLPLGDASAEQLRSIAELSRRFGNGTVRATNQQNLVLRWVPSMRLYALYRSLVEIGLGEADALCITDVVSCPGTDYCSLAITKSMGVAARIREYLEESSTRQDVDDVIARLGRFEIKISGCPNACGQHQVADIGMTGSWSPARTASSGRTTRCVSAAAAAKRRASERG